MRAGERVLLPAVREANEDVLVITDGFSCRSQIEHGAGGRRALHLAEVVAMGMGSRSDEGAPTGTEHHRMRAALATLGAAAVGGAAWSAVRAARGTKPHRPTSVLARR
jgi:hypothetical protein